MVVKQKLHVTIFSCMFEYGVILNGSQTKHRANSSKRWFEYGVILNGSQTK